VVAVTGANGNVGRALAQAALAQGARVALLDVNFGAGPPAPASVHRVNLLDAEATRACFAAIGRVDVLCNIAGGFTMGDPVHVAGDEVWTRMFDLNVRTLLNSVRAVVPGMLERKRGKIVNVGAIAGLGGAISGQANMGAYSAAKSAVIRITESMAAELKREGINVNCVLPSIIDTPQNRAAMPKADPARWVAPADLANVILFLASEEARAVHGAALPVVNLV
jgi:NAD(P)-dependent dehydrogenase (short-subunit alcohol dehydrogenase family)